MSYRTIPIRALPAASRGVAHLPPQAAPRLVGDAPRARSVLGALEAAVQQRARCEPGTWLDEFRLGPDEATLALRTDLGCDPVMVAQAAFDVLRRLLPDTDIYVGAARH
jgi:hypothetical protein